MTSNIAKGAKGKAGGVMGIVDNAVARPVATVALQGKKSMLKIRDVNIDKVVAWAKFDSLNSRRVQNRSAIARIYGALEIPWSDPGGFDAEIRARITVMQETMNMAAAGAEAVGQVVDGAMGGVTDMRKRK